MTNDIHAAFEAKYKASAQDPACAEELRVFSDGWNAARAGSGSGRGAFEHWARQVFQARDLELDEFGGYSGENVHGAWCAWETLSAEIRRIRDVRNDSAEEWRTEVRLCRETIAERDAEIAALKAAVRESPSDGNQSDSRARIRNEIGHLLADVADGVPYQDNAQRLLRVVDEVFAGSAQKDRTVRAMLTHYEKWGDTEGFGQMVQAVKELFDPDARQIRGDGGKERKG